jgi:hypothetical protein
MERVRIKAREKKRSAPETETAPTMPAAGGERPRRDHKKYADSLTVRYGTALYGTIQNIIDSSHAAQNFTYTSPSDFVRAALQAYKDGMPLTELEVPGEKMESKLRVPGELKRFYQSLPAQMRTKILERAIRTFIKNM